MSAYSIIDKYYPPGHPARNYYLIHAKAVTRTALEIARHNPGLGADEKILEQMALLHDIGIYLTHAPEIGCFGTHPYIMHGFLGREILEKEGLGDVAPVCERHVGVGLTKEDILSQGLPLPHRDMIPLTIEERMVCYADKFYSKSSPEPERPKTLVKIEKSIRKYGEDKYERFLEMVTAFGVEYIYHF